MATKTATVSEFRGKYSTYLEELQNDSEPLLLLNRGQQAAYVISPQIFDALIERLEDLEDIVEGMKALEEIRKDPSLLLDEEEFLSGLDLEE